MKHERMEREERWGSCHEVDDEQDSSQAPQTSQTERHWRPQKEIEDESEWERERLRDRGNGEGPSPEFMRQFIPVDELIDGINGRTRFAIHWTSKYGLRLQPFDQLQ